MKKRGILIALAALLVCGGVLAHAVRQGGGQRAEGGAVHLTAALLPEAEAADLEEAAVSPAGVTLVTDSHVPFAYGDGAELPAFRPWREITRAQAAQMLLRLLPEDVPSDAAYTDVPADAWYARAAGTMGALGVMRPGEAEFLPEELVTRGEFVRYVASFFPLRQDAELFTDVPEDDPDAPYIRSARAAGWARGKEDGTFHPEENVTRAEAAVLLNRALGREADRDYIDTVHPAFYVDVSPSHWFYYDVMEASVAHEHGDDPERWTGHTPRESVPADGFHLVDGWLYCYDSQRGDILRSESRGNFPFDAAGRFTSGSAELDAKLHAIVVSKTSSTMSQEEMLRALYLYPRDSFPSLRRPAYAFGAADFMQEDALRILNTGYGNCYCYASLLWYLTRWIGYDSVIYSGTVGSNRAPHSWVEIAFDGRYYIFDSELEMAYRRKKRFDIDLYKFYDYDNRWQYRRPAPAV